MTVTQYIGSRYVPVFADPADWSKENIYEPLTIVMYQGNSYTSKMTVPKGIEITDTKYWAETGNYNAQVEQYRKEAELAVDTAKDAKQTAETTEVNLATEITNREAAVSAEETRATAAEKKLTSDLADETSRAEAAEKVNADAITYETARAEQAENQLNSYISKEATRAKTAEEKLTSDLASEVTNRENADEKITNDLTKLIAAKKNVNGFIGEYRGQLVFNSGKYFVDTPSTETPCIIPQGFTLGVDENTMYAFTRTNDETVQKLYKVDVQNNKYSLVKTYSTLGHANNIVYNTVTNQYYVITGKAENPIAVLNADFSIKKFINVNTTWGKLGFDRVTKILYLVTDDFKVYIIDENDNVTYTNVTLNRGSEYSIVGQGSDAYNGKFYHMQGYSDINGGILEYDLTTGKVTQAIPFLTDNSNNILPFGEPEDISITEEGVMYSYSALSHMGGVSDYKKAGVVNRSLCLTTGDYAMSTLNHAKNFQHTDIYYKHVENDNTFYTPGNYTTYIHDDFLTCLAICNVKSATLHLNSDWHGQMLLFGCTMDMYIDIDSFDFYGTFRCDYGCSITLLGGNRNWHFVKNADNPYILFNVKRSTLLGGTMTIVNDTSTTSEKSVFDLGQPEIVALTSPPTNNTGIRNVSTSHSYSGFGILTTPFKWE